MHFSNYARSRAGCRQASLYTTIILALGLLLSACGGGGGGGNDNDSPARPVPPAALANTVVAYPSAVTELQLYAGQSRQVTLNFRTSDGGSATKLALSMPTDGLPAGWRLGSERSDCALVDGADLCQLALTYAPAAAEPSSVLTLAYSYRNNKGDPAIGSMAIPYGASAANAALATLVPAGPVRGVVGKTSSVVLDFGTNDSSPATELHVDTDLASMTAAGWRSAGAGLDCANFGAGSPCQLALSYTPTSAAAASALIIDYRYKDSSGRQQTAKATIDYSAIASNTVGVSASPAGVVRARAGSSQQVKLTFAPSDINAAGKLRLLDDIAALPAEWTVTDSTLPCTTVDGNGDCSMTLRYTPGPDQPAGKLDLSYAYTDATGRELAGTTAITYASHDYQAYVTDFGTVENDALTGGVRQCELDNKGKLVNCVKAATSWPLFGANNVVVYRSHAYIGAYTSAADGLPARPVTVCRVADDYALIDCKGSGPLLDQLSSLQVSGLGAYIISTVGGEPRIVMCPVLGDGELDGKNCGAFSNNFFKDSEGGVPMTMTLTDRRLYIAVMNPKFDQMLYSCSILPGDILNCYTIPAGLPEQVIQRMSSGQAGGKGYLYMAVTSRPDPEKVAGNIVKCALNNDGFATGCEKGVIPPGIDEADLIRISDIRIVRNNAFLVTGITDLAKKVYRCEIQQQTGDLAACVDAGVVEGVRNFSIAVR